MLDDLLRQKLESVSGRRAEALEKVISERELRKPVTPVKPVVPGKPVDPKKITIDVLVKLIGEAKNFHELKVAIDDTQLSKVR